VDVLILDPLPDDFGHLITINIDDSAGDTHFLESGSEVALGNLEHYFIYSLSKTKFILSHSLDLN